jgi:uncharacterized protein
MILFKCGFLEDRFKIIKVRAKSEAIKMDNKIIGLIRKHKKELKKTGIKTIGLFGSYSRNENTEESDVDLILEFEEGTKSFHNYMEACDILQKIIQKKLDIVTPESVSPYIKPYIDKEVVYEKL